MIDLHAHLLPGIDDGPDSWQDALRMLRIAQDDGIDTIVATSHQEDQAGYNNSNSSLIQLADELQRRVSQSGLSVRILPGAEVMATPDLIERLERGTALTLGNQGRYLLLEFPKAEVPRYAGQLIFDLQVRGITPVIAHPERNAVFAERPEELIPLAEAGVLLQLTAASLSSRASLPTRFAAVLLLTHNMAHILASDAHSVERRPPVLARYVSRLIPIVGKERAFSLVRDVPERIVRNESVQTPPLLPFSRKSRRQALDLARKMGRKRLAFPRPLSRLRS
ncbi:MAG: tyrosine-protein phosphatase [Limnochordia bacterium]|jgi:protein-tyrosine phosphatase